MPSMRRGIAAKGRANARYPVILRDSPSLGKDVADGLFAGAEPQVLAPTHNAA
jgi:hypothetical protein